MAMVDARPTSDSRPRNPALRAVPDDTSPGSVDGVVQAALAAVRRAGGISASGVGDAVEAPVRGLARKVTAEAVQRPRDVPITADLASALAERPRGPVLGGATAAAVGARIARRFGPLRFLARRTPMWLVAALVPALHASVTRGAEELRLVASHLALRARAAGQQPDPERVRRATVQIVTGAEVDPDAEPRHTTLALAWLRRAVRGTLPFSDGVATSDPHGLAAAAGAVPVSRLG